MSGKISGDPDRVVDGTEKVAATAGGANYGVLVSSILTYFAGAAVALTNKTINAASNTITNLTTGMFASSVVDTDATLAANSDTRLASQKAVKAYVDQLLGAQDAMIFKGVIDCSANPNYPAADRGHTYKVSVAGKIGGASGTNVEIGDMLICITDGTASGNQATVGAQWSIIQSNIDGAVTGPASSTSGNIATFTGTGGKTIQDGGLAIARGQYPAINSNTPATAGNIGEYLVGSSNNNASTFTVTIASPAVVTQAGHGYSTTGVGVFVPTTTGAMPTGLAAGTTYYVIPGSVSGNTFQVATSIANAFAGTAVNTSGTQSGTHTGTANVALADLTAKTIAAVQVQPGEWDLSFHADSTFAASTTFTQIIACVSATLDTLDISTPFAYNATFPASYSPGAVSVPIVGGPLRVSPSVSTIYYLVIRDHFATSTVNAWGFVRANRPH